MSTPIPLTAPDGTVYAYACGRCRCLASPPEAEAFAPVDRIAELSLARATKCCVCPCGAFVSETSCWNLCEPCSAKEEAKNAAAQEDSLNELAARGVRKCPECFGLGCETCNHTGEVPLCEVCFDDDSDGPCSACGSPHDE